jgi:hypothetical protein
MPEARTGSRRRGAVGSHLRVLLDTSAVLHRRVGRQVLYWRTSLGDALAVPPSP